MLYFYIAARTMYVFIVLQCTLINFWPKNFMEEMFKIISFEHILVNVICELLQCHTMFTSQNTKYEILT